jgi:hypothetical protein
VKHEGHFTHALERRVPRIELEVKVIRPIDVIEAGVPRDQLDAAEVHDPRERREIVDDMAGVNPLRSRQGSALHEKELAVRAVRIALHDDRPLREVGQQHGPNVQVVLEDCTLGDPAGGEETFLQVGQTNAVTPELEHRFVSIQRNARRCRLRMNSPT